jgi:uncharacterized protein YaaN involved in tellurite resistance
MIQNQAAQAPTDVLNTQKPEAPEMMTNVTAYKEELRKLPEVQALTNEINIQDPNTILKFGQKPSEDISKLSDQLLSSMKSVKSEECSRMLTQLTKIMDKFDIQEIKDPEEAKGLAKLFNRVKDNIEKLFEKYDNMGKEVDKVTVILKQYEHDIFKANDQLQAMYQANNEFYTQLEKYIVAGEMGVEEIEAYKVQVQNDTSLPANQIQMQVTQLDMMRDMLAQRVFDLQIAENVAMQTCPMIQMMQQNNANLLRKINSSFIITLPIFKQCLIQAIQLKRASIQSKAMNDLDEHTRKLWERNAQNTATQSVAIARQAGTSAIDVATLEKSYQTILQGIADTEAINKELEIQRNQDSVKLENMKADMHKKGFA